jgi:hypothetical protein
MTTDTEAVLSAEDVRAILAACAPHGVLGGGQALAFWADRLTVHRPADLQAAVTADADFIGDSALARKLGEKLGWQCWIPSLDDVTSQTGKVTRKLKDGSVKQVDFLSGVVGLTTKDVVRRASELQVQGIGTLRVMHPIDVLDSRIQNLDLIPAKRNKMGIAQAALAVAVARAWIHHEIHAEGGERAALKLLERVVAIAEDIGAIRVFLLHGIEPLDAVPVNDFVATSNLHTKRWPQIVARVTAQREKIRRLMESRGRKPRTKLGQRRS